MDDGVSGGGIVVQVGGEAEQKREALSDALSGGDDDGDNCIVMGGDGDGHADSRSKILVSSTKVLLPSHKVVRILLDVLLK